ncbi:MAG: hypothetical protein AAGG44_12140 [Planctomycetota bacterium]
MSHQKEMPLDEPGRQLTCDDSLDTQQETILAQFQLENMRVSPHTINRFNYAVRWIPLSMGAQSGWGVESLNSNISRAVGMLNSLKEDDQSVVFSESMRANLKTFIRTAAIKIGDCETPERLCFPQLN